MVPLSAKSLRSRFAATQVKEQINLRSAKTPYVLLVASSEKRVQYDLSIVLSAPSGRTSFKRLRKSRCARSRARSTKKGIGLDGSAVRKNAATLASRPKAWALLPVEKTVS